MPASAPECLGRGLASLRANWPLVLCQWLQQVVVTGLAVAGALVPLAAVGSDRLRDLLELGVEGPAALVEPLLALVAQRSVPLAVALVGTLIVWTLAFLVFCWFQGGFYGVLMAAERQAPPGARGPALFRIFSLQHYAGWGARLLWRYFWFWNLYALVLLGALLLVALLLLGVVIGHGRWGDQAVVAIGCGGSLPLLVLLVLVTLWSLLAAAELGREETTVLAAARHAQTVLARRPLAVLLLGLVGVVGGVVLGLLFLPLSAFAVSPGIEAVAAQAGVMLLQALPAAVLTTFLAAAFVALVAREPA